VQAIKRVGDQDPGYRLPSYSLAGLMMLKSDPAVAEQLLDVAFATGRDPADSEFISTYLSARLELSIARGIRAELPVNRDAVGLALAELKQEHEDLAGAVDIVEQLEPNTYTAISLAELYAETDRWDEVIEHAVVDDPKRFRRAALPWHARYCAEIQDVGFEEAHAVLACLAGLAGRRPKPAAAALAGLVHRRGLERASSVLVPWVLDLSPGA
jgi:hypothetical protein